MGHSLLRCLFVLALLAWRLPAHAHPGEFCVDPARRWCLGTVSMALHENRAEATMFSNGDLLVGVTEHGRTARMLQRSTEQRPLFFGLTEHEQRPGGVGFKFSAEGWAIPIGALALAFPDGPASVPVTAVDVPVNLGGEHLIVSAWHLPGERIGFRLAKLITAPIISGEFSSTKPAPVADTVIAAWGPGVHAEPLVRLPPPPAPAAQ